MAQLASIRYMLNARGQVVDRVQGRDAQAGGVRSPDHAEAIMSDLAEPRGGGLIELWREQAEVLKRQGQVDTGHALAQAPEGGGGSGAHTAPKPGRQ